MRMWGLSSILQGSCEAMAVSARTTMNGIMSSIKVMRVRVRNGLYYFWVHEYMGVGKCSWSAVFQDVVSSPNRRAEGPLEK